MATPEAEAGQPWAGLAAPSPEALAWWALQFTPHVAWVDEALLLEVSGTLRLWGGRRALLQQIFESNPHTDLARQAQAATSLVALACLRLRVEGGAGRVARASDLPLHTLSAARPHLPVLARLGCRSWGDLAALPRAGLARRFGPELVQALDVAFGRAPDVYPWATLPERFAERLELPTRVDTAPALLWSASRLLASLQLWLRARQLGVLAVELRWRLDVRRLNGQELPPEQALVVGTAEPVQHTEHLRRLLAERLARTPMLAPAVGLALSALRTAPWQAASHSLLPQDRRGGDPLHVFIERVSARLGPGQLLAAEPQADHRPERRQRWHPAEALLAAPAPQAGRPRGKRAQGRGDSAMASTPAAQKHVRIEGLMSNRVQASPTVHAEPVEAPREAQPGAARTVGGDRRPPGTRPNAGQAGAATGDGPRRPPSSMSPGLPADWPDALAPTTLLPEPLALPVHGGQPHYRGPLRLLTEPRRIEAGWWSDAEAEEGALPAARERGGHPAAGPFPRRGAAPRPGEAGAPSPAWGSAADEVVERGGAISPPPGRPKAARAPSGGSAACEAAERGGAVSRDYFIAQNPRAELLWVFRERPTAARPGAADEARWFLHGLYV